MIAIAGERSIGSRLWSIVVESGKLQPQLGRLTDLLSQLDAQLIDAANGKLARIEASLADLFEANRAPDVANENRVVETKLGSPGREEESVAALPSPAPECL